MEKDAGGQPADDVRKAEKIRPMTFTVWHIVGASIIVAIVAAVVASIRTRRKDIKKVAYMMDALEDGELNFRFQDKNKFNRTLNRIRTIFEKQRQAHEQDSWTKLIRVLTHEIMNTVSPIASLSDALSKSMDENGHSELDVKTGLETISDSSKNLITFVETYRQLSGVARPVRKAIDLSELMEGVIALNSEFAASCGAICQYRPEEEDLMIYVDEGQCPDGQGGRCDGPSGQRWRAHSCLCPGADFYPVLYHQKRRLRHRPFPGTANHAAAQRHHRPAAQRCEPDGL